MYAGHREVQPDLYALGDVYDAFAKWPLPSRHRSSAVDADRCEMQGLAADTWMSVLCSLLQPFMAANRAANPNHSKGFNCLTRYYLH